MKLFSYWRSTTSYRVRAALNLKGLRYDIIPVDLAADAQLGPEYRAINPGRGVPCLVLADGTSLTQSLAMIDYLDEVAGPPLLPTDALSRARVLAAAHTIALDVHPANNLRVIKYLKTELGADQDAVVAWMKHWMIEGFDSLETLISDDARFCFGDAPDLADLCLVAQVYNADRWGLDLTAYPKIQRVAAACRSHPAIAAAHPDHQPDAKVA